MMRHAFAILGIYKVCMHAHDGARGTKFCKCGVTKQLWHSASWYVVSFDVLKQINCTYIDFHRKRTNNINLFILYMNKTIIIIEVYE